METRLRQVPPEDDEVREELALVVPAAEVVEALREQLLPQLPFGQVLSAYVNATPLDTLRQCTRWSLLWRTYGADGEGQLTAALCQDLRDRRLAVFGEPTAVETLLMACPGIARRDAFTDTGEGVFHGVDDRLDGAVRRALLHHVGNIIYDDPYDGWVLQDEAVFNQVQLKALSPGLYEDVIHEEDAELINSKWPYSSATSLATILDCIRSRPSACIRKRNEEGEDEPIAWSLVRVEGQVGMTYTAEAFRGQGLAKRVVVQLCKKLLELRDPKLRCSTGDNHSTPWTPYCYIDADNIASSSMFASLGFKKVGTFRWIKV